MIVDDPRDPPDEIEEGEDGDEGEDAGLGDDEGGDEAEARAEPEGAEAEEGLARKPGRGERAVLEAKRVARESQAREAALQREVEELRALRQQAQPQGETAEQEQARLSLMTAEERIDYKLAKAKRENEQQINAIRFQAADQSDKASYDAKSSYEPRYKKYAADVEKLLAEERRKGNNWPRETILMFVLGKRVMENKPAADKQRQQGQARIARQRTQADGGRSDRAASRGRLGSGNTLADLEARLEGVNI